MADSLSSLGRYEEEIPELLLVGEPLIQPADLVASPAEGAVVSVLAILTFGLDHFIELGEVVLQGSGDIVDLFLTDFSFSLHVGFQIHDLKGWRRGVPFRRGSLGA